MIDYLILGGGSAGCVLASRLSEDPTKQVVLVEAGRNISATTMPANIAARYPGGAYSDVNNIWPKLTAYIGAPRGSNAPRTPRRYEQGRVLGGGSAVNALVANRGGPSDYDEWGEMGAEGWSFDAALPYFRKLEHDYDIDNEWHGQTGPLPIRRITDAKRSPFVTGVMRALNNQGYPTLPDQNGKWQDGVYVGAIAKDENGRRVPTSVVYLSDAVRGRPNLRIITDHLAQTVTFDGRKATGAVICRADGGGPTETLTANEVIVSTGAIHTPALLMRSGIGPADQLGKFNIPVVAQLAGVGRNLMEHPSTAVSTYLPPQSRLLDLDEHHDHAILRFSSKLPGTPEGDMHFGIIARSAWHSIGQRVGTLFIWVNKAYSRGHVELISADVRDEPLVDFNMLSDDRDLERLKIGFRVGAKALTDPSMANVAGPVFPTTYSPRVAKVGAPGAWNQIQRGLFSGLLDFAGPARRAVLESVVTLGITLDSLLKDDRALAEFVTNGVAGVWHASGTARMGAASDRLAVTNGAGRVHGVDGLRVVDASLMPSIPRANTNIPTIMMAERIADLIKARQ